MVRPSIRADAMAIVVSIVRWRGALGCLGVVIVCEDLSVGSVWCKSDASLIQG